MRREAKVCITVVVLAMLFCLGGLAGCQAPRDIQTSHEFEEKAITSYLTNSRTTHETLIELYQRERERRTALVVEKAARETLAVVADKDGKVTVDQALQLAQATLVEDAKARAGTAAVVAKVRIMMDKSAKDAMNALRLHRAMGDYLAAGVDKAFFGELAESALDIFSKINTTHK